MEGGKAKAGGQNERMELIGKGRERTDRKKEKRVGRERERKEDKLFGVKEEGGHVGRMEEKAWE